MDLVKVLEDGKQREVLVNALCKNYKDEIQDYSEANFNRLLSQCKDRKSLLRLVNKEITFDQFVTKHNCDNEGLKYSCKDDLL